MMKRRVWMALGLLFVLLLLFTFTSSAEAPLYVMLRGAVTGGGIADSSGALAAADGQNSAAPPPGYRLSGVVGQTAAGYAANAGGHLVSGFWFWYWRSTNIPREYVPLVFDRYAP